MAYTKKLTLTTAINYTDQTGSKTITNIRMIGYTDDIANEKMHVMFGSFDASGNQVTQFGQRFDNVVPNALCPLGSTAYTDTHPFTETLVLNSCGHTGTVEDI